jgi:hypothetical protein
MAVVGKGVDGKGWIVEDGKAASRTGGDGSAWERKAAAETECGGGDWTGPDRQEWRGIVWKGPGWIGRNGLGRRA